MIGLVLVQNMGEKQCKAGSGPIKAESMREGLVKLTTRPVRGQTMDMEIAKSRSTVETFTPRQMLCSDIAERSHK